MVGCWKLALSYLTYYWARTCILIAALTVTLCLPLATRWVIERFELEASARASATPILIGPKGSAFGLVMHALYFRGEAAEVIPQSELERVKQNPGITAIGLCIRYKVQDITIVGSDDQYLRHRQLTLAAGEPMERLGDCLVGARAASVLNVVPNDRVVTEPQNVFDLSAAAPFALRVRGILRPTGTADDDVIHCHVKTCWLIAGLGHGHSIQPAESITERSDDRENESATHRHAAARENLSQYSEVTDENLSSFHFHGSQSSFPLTAIIAIPETEKAATLLLGKYFQPEDKVQAVQPNQVVSEMLRMVGQVRRLLDTVAGILALATTLLTVLVLWLSLKLRQRELRTLVLIGTGPGKLAAIVGLEIGLVIAISFLLALLLASGIAYSSSWIFWFF